MALKYKLVQRKDLRKGAAADSKLYYASANVTGKMDFALICETIADRSTASKGDVMLIIDGLLHVVSQAILRGETVHMGEFGNFRATLGSSGSTTEADFTASMIRTPHIVFHPGKLLKGIADKISFERITPKVVEKECDKDHVEIA